MTERIIDKVNENEVKVYYIGEVNTDLDNALIKAMETQNYEFSGMSHQRGVIHRLTFNPGWE